MLIVLPLFVILTSNEVISHAGLFGHALLLRCQKPQSHLFPFNETGRNMEPLLFRYRLQVKRTRLASHNAGTTSDALVPVIYRLPAIFRFFPGMCKKLATPDALPAVGAFVIILHDAVVRSLDRLLQTCPHALPAIWCSSNRSSDRRRRTEVPPLPW